MTIMHIIMHIMHMIFTDHEYYAYHECDYAYSDDSYAYDYAY